MSIRDNLRHGGAAALASLAILATPMAAYAKGGGHGGGGHSSGHSSGHSVSRSYSAPRSSSSSRSTSSHSSYSAPRSSSSSRGTSSHSSYSAPRGSSSRRSSSRSSRSSRSSSSSGSSYSSPGRVGGRVRPRPSPPSPPVEYEPSPPVVYAPSPPVVVRRSSPSVIVRDAPSVIYRTPTEDAYWNGVWSARLEGATIAASAAYVCTLRRLSKEGDSWGGDAEMDETDADDEVGINYAHELTETNALMRELQTEHASMDPLAVYIDKPVDGDYRGESAEDDAGDQDVRTTLTFGRDGSVAGSGYDGVDGAYTIRKGAWSQKRVAWIEQYDEGFTVALRGQVRPDGTIIALWASSRGVGGSVSLEAPRA